MANTQKYTTKTKRFTRTFPINLMARVDAKAAELGISSSAFIVQALNEKLKFIE